MVEAMDHRIGSASYGKAATGSKTKHQGGSDRTADVGGAGQLLDEQIAYYRAHLHQGRDELPRVELHASGFARHEVDQVEPDVHLDEG